MRNRVLFIGVLFLAVCLRLGAQQAIPEIKDNEITFKSPNVAPLFNMVDCPVSYFNGTANISIPLCQVESGGMSIPITLNYSSTGFRPSAEASWVGLGWSLSLNSSISRTIQAYLEL